MLLKNAHPDLCGYRGVTVNDQGLVTDLIFDRYDWDLAETVAARHQFDGDACFQTVERAVKHVHSLGYNHYDLKPENIFYNVSHKRSVLGDFDCVHRIGAKLRLKNGARGWVPPGLTRDDKATEEIDSYGIEVLNL
jgi:serine/threonine protein kinase